MARRRPCGTWLLPVLASLLAAPLTPLPRARAQGHSENFELLRLPHFVDPLPLPAVTRLDLQTDIAMSAHKTTHTFHRDLPPSPVYAFGSTLETATVPGPTLLASRGVPVSVRWRNNITDRRHMLPVDFTIAAPEPLLGFVPMVPHLHGMTSESTSDGHPQAWFSAFGDVGPTYVKETYSYPNSQPGSTMWYHDHTLAMTRLNVKAGLYGMYILRDEAKEAALGLPEDEFDIPLLITDMDFYSDGRIFFPLQAANLAIHMSWRPESFGRFPIVNGKVAPFLEVQRRKYRFRLVNSGSSRFFNLSLCLVGANSTITSPANGPLTVGSAITTNESSTAPTGEYRERMAVGRQVAPGIALYPDGGNCYKLPIVQVATDGGFLPSPVTSDDLLLGPGQRAEIIVDFSSLAPDMSVVMTNSAPIPYPWGGLDNSDPLWHVMLFRLQANTSFTDVTADNSTIPEVLETYPPLEPEKAVNYPNGRSITISEQKDGEGNPVTGLLESLHWNVPSTINPRMGTSEIWSYINLTPDAHPVHFHFLPQRVVDRQEVNVTSMQAGTCNFEAGECFTGEPIPPAPNELGHLDTVIAFPQTVTRVLVDFDPQDRVISFSPSRGPGYVIHCHILDHEDNDMMRPVTILPASTGLSAIQSGTQAQITLSTFLLATLTTLSLLCMLA